MNFNAWWNECLSLLLPPPGYAFILRLIQLQRGGRGGPAVENTSHQGWCCQQTPTLRLMAKAKADVALPEVKKPVPGADTVSQISVSVWWCWYTWKNHLQWQYPGFIYPASKSRWLFASAKGVWSSTAFLFPKIHLVFAMGWIIQPPDHTTDPVKAHSSHSSFSV